MYDPNFPKFSNILCRTVPFVSRSECDEKRVLQETPNKQVVFISHFILKDYGPKHIHIYNKINFKFSLIIIILLKIIEVII